MGELMQWVSSAAEAPWLPTLLWVAAIAAVCVAAGVIAWRMDRRIARDREAGRER